MNRSQPLNSVAACFICGIVLALASRAAHAQSQAQDSIQKVFPMPEAEKPDF